GDNVLGNLVRGPAAYRLRLQTPLFRIQFGAHVFGHIRRSHPKIRSTWFDVAHERPSRGGLGRRRMVVHMSFLSMLGLFLLLAVIVTMGQRVVVVLVGMPVRAVFPLAQ